MKTICLITMASVNLAFCLMATPVVAQINWPQFRGPGSRGVAEDFQIPEHWSANDNIAWKKDIPGRGWSSPVVWNDHVFLTTVVNTGESEEARKGLYFGGNRPLPPDAVHQWKVICLNLKTGETRWERLVREGKPLSSIHIKSSFASETPVTDGERVYCCFGNVGIYCFDFAGNELWQYELAPLPTRLGWGTAASPVLHEGSIYYCYDNEEQSFLLALDAETGKEVWKTLRDEKSNWATPYVWQNELRTEIVTPGSGAVRSYNLEGKLLWSLKGMSSITIATPYAANGLLFLSSGYVGDQDRPIYAIKPGAAGDISLKDDATSNEFIAWMLPDAGPYNPTTLVSENRLFVLYDRGLIACYRATTGEELYSRQRLPGGRAFTSSPWASDGKIFCLNEDGVTFVLRDSDQFELLRTNPLDVDDMGMATPAMAQDTLLIRTAARIYCIKEMER
ncbi:MAG: PQQ-binding-like beta-propeller repeat protein [Planctomycetaceae bacterium]|nr:PQQ-binding-like beta-propeller repeat protein [Planctomycetaceae bacterium]